MSCFLRGVGAPPDSLILDVDGSLSIHPEFSKNCVFGI